MPKPSRNALALRLPPPSFSKIARRVGSARALKIESSSMTTNKHTLICQATKNPALDNAGFLRSDFREDFLARQHVEFGDLGLDHAGLHVHALGLEIAHDLGDHI